MKRGLLLINLGTPKAPNQSSVRQYLNEFLIDRRVIDLARPLRHALVKGLILPFRTKKSTEAYKTIWLSEGSPLLVYSQELAARVQEHLGQDYKVVLAMRYGKPSIVAGLAELKDCHELIILPLYPQYSSAATGSAIEECLTSIAQQEVIPAIKIINHFYQHPAYRQAQTELIKSSLAPDHHLLFSYHGIPERQLSKTGCVSSCINECAPNCYKAQCYRTSTLLAQELKLAKQHYTTSFQSRLGKTPWIKPYTDEVLVSLTAQGIKKLTVVCPSFVTDCLETLEEIGIRAKEQWMELGGEDFVLVPSMNSHSAWVSALSEIAQKPST